MNVELERLLRYDRWGNLAMLQSLREAEAPPERALRIMAHIAATHELWLSRIESGGPVTVWPEPDLDRIEASLRATNERLLRLPCDGGNPTTIRYVNSQGERWESTVAEILAHIVIHSAYHRGQIALLLASAGGAPAYTDFIQATRTGLV